MGELKVLKYSWGSKHINQFYNIQYAEYWIIEKNLKAKKTQQLSMQLGINSK